MQKVKYYRWAPALGTFEDSPEKIWGVKPYDPESEEPCVFCGLYGLPDFYTMWRYKGPKYIWWTGSDIRHFISGYWLDTEGSIKISPRSIATWIRKHCESWVENDVEAEALRKFGIESKICPSFLGDVNQFEISYKPSDRPKIYTSVSGDDFELYGWYRIPKLARDNPGIEFHLYGNTKHPFPAMKMLVDADKDDKGILIPKNIIIHGRVPKEQFNKEIKEMQGSLRLTSFDGFSEIIAKSILMGQYPVSLIPYPFTLDPKDISILKNMTEPNIEGREHYLKEINNYPWSKR